METLPYLFFYNRVYMKISHEAIKRLRQEEPDAAFILKRSLTNVILYRYLAAFALIAGLWPLATS